MVDEASAQPHDNDGEQTAGNEPEHHPRLSRRARQNDQQATDNARAQQTAGGHERGAQAAARPPPQGQPGAVGVEDEAAELAADEQSLRRFVDEHVGDIARLPADLADAALAALPAAALRQALVDAEASVLALLGETAATRADS